MTTNQSYYLRRTFTWIALIVGIIALILLSPRLTTPSNVLLADFIEYWSAGRLNANGQNPYDTTLLSDLRLQVNPVSDIPLLMWNPPWAVALAMPFGLLSYPVSRMLWYLTHLCISLACFSLLWDLYGGARQWRWAAWVVGFFHWATLEVLRSGQITPLILLGAVGFVVFEKRQQPWAAGACLALLTLKPHLLYLFSLTVLFWVVKERQWRVLLGGGAAILIATMVACLPNPSQIGQYIYAVTHYPPAQWVTATIGGILRLQLGPEMYLLQFFPLLPGTLWVLLYWKQHHQCWDWTKQLPILALASLITAAYGWRHDQMVTVFALIQVAVWFFIPDKWQLKTVLAFTYLIMNWILITTNQPQHWFWWVPIWVAVWYLVALRTLKSKEQPT